MLIFFFYPKLLISDSASFVIKCSSIDMLPNSHKVLTTWLNYMHHDIGFELGQSRRFWCINLEGGRGGERRIRPISIWGEEG